MSLSGRLLLLIYCLLISIILSSLFCPTVKGKKEKSFATKTKMLRVLLPLWLLENVKVRRDTCISFYWRMYFFTRECREKSTKLRMQIGLINQNQNKKQSKKQINFPIFV